MADTGSMVPGIGQQFGSRNGKIAIFEKFLEFPVLATTPKWHALLSSEPITIEDRLRFAAHVLIIKELAVEPPSDFLLLKGVGLAKLVYPSPLKRHSVDVDILVDPKSVEAWIEFLNRRGFDGSIAANRLATNQAVFYHKLGVLELHWALGMPPVPAIPFPQLLDRSCEISINDTSIRALAPLDGALHLCIHFHQHLGSPSVLLDLALWVDTFEISPVDLIAHAATWGLESVVKVPLALLSIIQMIPVPPNVLPYEHAIAELLLEGYRKGLPLEFTTPIVHYFYQLLSCLLLPQPLRALSTRLFFGQHKFGRALNRLRPPNA